MSEYEQTPFEVESLWPIPESFKSMDQRDPRRLLLEQASLLTIKTNGYFIGACDVHTFTDHRSKGDVIIVSTNLDIIVPNVDKSRNYTWRVLGYTHEMGRFYPGTVVQNAFVHVTDEREFLAEVKRIISSDRIRELFRLFCQIA